MQRNNDGERQDPFAGQEPVEALGLTGAPTALARRAKGRKRPPRPAEKRRRRRFMGVTFSDPSIPDRLRALARRWGMYAPDGTNPHVSALLEYLILPQLEAAEAGEINPPKGISEGSA